MARVDNTSRCLSLESRTSSPVRGSPASDRDQNSDDHDIGGERELNLSLRTRCRIPFKVKKTDTLKTLKQACLGQPGVSEKLLDCFFDRYHLHDRLTYENVMAVLFTRIIVKVPNSKPELKTTIIGKINDTVSMVKSIARHKLHLKSTSYDLMFKGAYLEGHVGLGSLHVPSDSVFYMVKRPCESLTIVVFTPEKKVTFQVKKAHSIWDAKAIACSMMNLDVEKSALMIDGCPTILDETKTFCSLNIQDKSIFKLVFPFDVFVSIMGGPEVCIKVLSCDCVDDLNRKVCTLLRWTHYHYPFFYRGAKLQSHLNIAYYGITEGSTLLMGSLRG